ncbi:zinc finger BED domain-containing protein RICESLEEPER 2-like [Castanea sativa]|uniref:zinc finger BED domain-containing protein RICESLEEPER 2-like n=1 Tax=Castanea sativa TaxID=21020 RepID=UPI003F64D171
MTKEATLVTKVGEPFIPKVNPFGLSSFYVPKTEMGDRNKSGSPSPSGSPLRIERCPTPLPATRSLSPFSRSPSPVLPFGSSPSRSPSPLCPQQESEISNGGLSGRGLRGRGTRRKSRDRGRGRARGFVYVPSPHTKDVLAEVLVDCFLEWNTDRKLSTITVDNCSTNDAMIRLLLNKLDNSSLMLSGSMLYMRCVAHILNLIVQDWLSLIGDGIERICDSVIYWTRSPKRRQKFDENACQLRVQCTKELVLDCETCSNSTYLMISTALIYKDVFSCLAKLEAFYTCLPHDYDWEVAKDICGRLELFHSVTEFFSGHESPVDNEGSSHMPASILNHVAQIKFRLSGAISSFDLFVNNSSSSSKKHRSARMKFDHFIDEGVLKRSEDFDILAWWKSNGLKYHILQRIARDILVILITTVASESAFSTSGRLLNSHHSRLHPKTRKAMMCAQNWLQRSSTMPGDYTLQSILDDGELNEEDGSWVTTVED